MAEDAAEQALEDEYAFIDAELETKPYVVRFYDPATGPVSQGIRDIFEDDDTGNKLEELFCGYDIRGVTISIHAAEADVFALLYDTDSAYTEDEDAFTFAAFALLNRRGKKLYVDIICTSKESRDAKKRYGEAMLKAIEEFAAKNGFSEVELDAIDSAKGFYTKMGYVEKGPGEDGTIMNRGLKTGGAKLRLKTLRRSHKKEKKWDAVFEQDGKQKVVPFGQRGYSDFTKHKDTKRRQRYIDRHARMGEDWKDPTTPGALSRFILWNKKTLRASLRDFKKKFHV